MTAEPKVLDQTDSRFGPKDQILLSNILGRIFVRFYYLVSSDLAGFFVKNRKASVLIRALFIHPLAIRIR